tara:strand:- start:195 stop:755 length:561 start_codon:yes stop_codon:yes gene_type:complete
MLIKDRNDALAEIVTEFANGITTPEDEITLPLKALMQATAKAYISGVKSATSPMQSKSDLPCPRFQFRWVRENTVFGETLPSMFRDADSEMSCYYELVIPREDHDIRGEDREVVSLSEINEPHELIIPLDHTITSYDNESPRDFDQLTPFRSGAHAKWDRKNMGVDWPTYIISPDNTAHLLRENNG